MSAILITFSTIPSMFSLSIRGPIVVLRSFPQIASFLTSKCVWASFPNQLLFLYYYSISHFWLLYFILIIWISSKLILICTWLALSFQWCFGKETQAARTANKTKVLCLFPSIPFIYRLSPIWCWTSMNFLKALKFILLCIISDWKKTS